MSSHFWNSWRAGKENIQPFHYIFNLNLMKGPWFLFCHRTDPQGQALSNGRMGWENLHTANACSVASGVWPDGHLPPAPNVDQRGTSLCVAIGIFPVGMDALWQLMADQKGAKQSQILASARPAEAIPSIRPGMISLNWRHLLVFNRKLQNPLRRRLLLGCLALLCQ